MRSLSLSVSLSAGGGGQLRPLQAVPEQVQPLSPVLLHPPLRSFAFAFAVRESRARILRGCVRGTVNAGVDHQFFLTVHLSLRCKKLLANFFKQCLLQVLYRIIINF